jgi:hypothetical protein
VLRAAAGRLAPDAETRVTLRKQEVAVRDLAIRAEVHPDPEIRKTAAAGLRCPDRSNRGEDIGLCRRSDRRRPSYSLSKRGTSFLSRL